MVLAQAFGARHPPEYNPTLPPFDSLPPLHPSPQFLSLQQELPTMEALQPTQQLGLQHAYHQNHRYHLVQVLQLQLAHSQQQREQLKLKLVRQEEQIQRLQRQLMHHQQQHTQHIQHPQQLVSPPFRQQLVSQQPILMDSGLQPSMQPSPDLRPSYSQLQHTRDRTSRSTPDQQKNQSQKDLKAAHERAIARYHITS